MLLALILASALGADWLLDPEPYRAKITISDDRVVLENGLVSRTITLKPAPATISIRNLTTGDEHLRAISPEARVTIDGAKPFEVALDRECRAAVKVSIPAEGYAWILVTP